jgi:DNA-binding NarL/FixJ family response regulator
MIRVLLADDHKLVREGFRAILARAGDIEMVAEARDGQDAIRLAQELEPDVVLMDIAMPGCNGIEAARRVQSGPAAPRVVILTGLDSPEMVREALEEGVKGYVSKLDGFEELVTAVHEVYAGRPYLSTTIARLVGSGEYEG